MSERGWLDDAESAAEVELRDGLDQARARLPDQVALRRLWGRVASPELRRPARTRWTWFAGGVVSSAALALGLAFFFWPAGSVLRREVRSPVPVALAVPAAAGLPVSPGVSVARAAEGDPARAKVAAAVPPSPPVIASGLARTGPGETRRVVLRGGAEARLERSSLVSVVPEANGNARPRIERGEVSFNVPHQPAGQSFSVLAGPYRILVVGTKFRVRVEGAEVAVSVDEGVVEIWRKRRLARLSPGDSWSSPSSEPHAHAGAAGVRAARSTTASPLAAPPVSAAPAPAPAAPGADPATRPAPSDGASEARAALAAGEPRRALAAYRAIAARGGSAAENAEYEIGRILRDRLGEPEGAIAAWRRYRSLHPDGLLRIETDVSIIETLVSSGDAGAGLAEANEFLRRHPDSERRAEIARVAGDLYRARGDCSHAVLVYQAALSAPRSRDIADYVSFHRASCLVSLGESSAGDALESYLRTWPSGRFRGDANRLLRRLRDPDPSR